MPPPVARAGVRAVVLARRGRPAVAAIAAASGPARARAGALGHRVVAPPRHRLRDARDGAVLAAERARGRRRGGHERKRGSVCFEAAAAATDKEEAARVRRAHEDHQEDAAHGEERRGGAGQYEASTHVPK